MNLLIYLGPVCLVATVIFAVLGNQEAMELAALSWLTCTFVFGWFAFPRTIPEKVMTLGNDALFVLAIMAGLLGWI